MIGRSHVACAAAGWVLVAPPVAAALGYTLTPLDLVASLAVAAGAGVGPDIDHPEATIARTHGPLSEVVSEIVCKASGGHRHATHWLITAAAVAGLVQLAGTRWPAWTVAFALATCGAWMLRVAIPDELHRGFWAPIVAAAAGIVAYRLGVTGWWVGLAVGFGWAAHIVCDWVEAGSGVPLFGPFDRRRHAAHLFHNGGAVEHLIAAAAAVSTIGLIGWHLAP